MHPLVEGLRATLRLERGGGGGIDWVGGAVRVVILLVQSAATLGAVVMVMPKLGILANNVDVPRHTPTLPLHTSLCAAVRSCHVGKSHTQWVTSAYQAGCMDLCLGLLGQVPRRPQMI